MTESTKTPNQAKAGTTAPLVQVERLVSDFLVIKKPGDWKGATLRFENGQPCCTCTYNYSMENEDRAYLARRIAAAMNATRGYTLKELESISR